MSRRNTSCLIRASSLLRSLPASMPVCSARSGPTSSSAVRSTSYDGVNSGAARRISRMQEVRDDASGRRDLGAISRASRACIWNSSVRSTTDFRPKKSSESAGKAPKSPDGGLAE